MSGDFRGPSQEEVGITSEKVDKQKVDRLLNLIKIRVESGELNFEKVKNLIVRDTNPVEKEIDGSIFDYKKVGELGGEIISLKGEGKTSLYKGMTVELVGDSKGYVPSGHKNGECATIIGFRDPEEGDRVVEVSGGGKVGYIKPSNIKSGE